MVRFSIMSDTGVIAYIDGACSGNPGPGGWGVLLQFGDTSKELWGGEDPTTNNRMELMAAIKALETLTRKVPVLLVTDSTYLKNGVQLWLPKWKANGWRTSAKKAVKNRDLWQRIDALVTLYQPSWKWVKGHSGDPGNERADTLARKGISA